MDLANGIKIAYETKWSMINTFDVKIDLNRHLAATFGEFGDINLNVININTPDFTNSPIDQFIANRWFIHNGRDELYRFNITFRDQDQMSLYKKFKKIYDRTKDNYFDKVCFTVQIKKETDWAYQSEAEEPFMSFNETIIEGVSNLQFNNTTENQIAEFTVSFKCVSVTIK